MKIKRALSMLMALVMAVSMLPTWKSAAETANVDIDAGSVTADGTDSFGDLLSETINGNVGVNEGVADDYGVTNAVVTGDAVTVEYNTATEALLVIAFYSENRAVLHTSVQTMVAAGTYCTVVDLPADVPEFYVLKAYLIHPTGLYPLCGEFESILYTSWMQELICSTVEDYDPELVWNFDDDNTTNFGVFHSTVVRITAQEGVNRVTEVDDTAHRYVIEDANKTVKDLEPGDIVWYPYGGGNILVFKVGEITVEDSIVTILGAPLEMADIFSDLKLETKGNTEDVIQPRSGDAVTNGNEQNPYIASVGFEIDPENGIKVSSIAGDIEVNENKAEDGEDEEDGIFGFELKGTVNLTFRVSFYYYIAENYSHIRFQTQITNYLKLEISGKLTPVKLKLPELGLPILNGAAFLSIQPTFSVSVSIEGTFELTTYPQIGFRYQTGMILPESLERTWADPLIGEPKVEGSITVGMELKNSLSLLDLGELELAKFSIPAETNLKLKIARQDNNSALTPPEDAVSGEHQCDLCFGIELTLEIEISVETELCEFIQWKLTLQKSEIQLADWYFSVTAMNAGKDEFCGRGSCPYWGHKVTVIVQDAEGLAHPGALVYYIENDQIVEVGIVGESGAVDVVLTPGTYTFCAIVNGETLSEKVKLEGREVIILSALVERLREDPDFFREYTDADQYARYGELIDSGSCGSQGDNVLWHMYQGEERRTLVVVGVGDMMDYTSAGSIPWEEHGTLAGNDVIVMPGVTKIGDYAFACFNVENVELPDGLTRIGNFAFYYSWIDSIHIPEQVYFIGESAFEHSSLKHITIPDSVETIGREAFLDCRNLLTANISNNVTRLERGTFQGCKKLHQVTLPRSVRYLGTSCFNACIALEGIYLPDSIQSMGDYVFLGTGLRQVDLPAGLSVVSDYAFWGCDNLVRVGCPEGLTEIASYAFWSCDSLQAINFPGTLERIGGWAFEHCTALNQIIFPDSLKVLGYQAFACCENLRYVVFWGDCPNKYVDLLGEESEYFQGWGPIYSPLQLIHPDAVVYYPANAEGWTQKHIDAMDYESETIQWIPFDVAPPAPDADLLTLTAEPEITEIVIVEAQVYAEKTSEEETQTQASVIPEGYDMCSVEFSALIPNREYMILVVADPEAADLMAADNLLYLTQETANDQGCLRVTCFTQGGAGVAIAFTAPRKNVADAQITFPDTVANGTDQLALPTVVYDGVTLILGVDYSLSGDICYSEPGIYICYISGINNYTGTVACEYTVTEQKIMLGDINGDNSIDIFDANLVAAYFNEIKELDALQLAAGDVNEDGEVDIFDANLIASYYNEAIDKFPAE